MGAGTAEADPTPAAIRQPAAAHRTVVGIRLMRRQVEDGGSTGDQTNEGKAAGSEGTGDGIELGVIHGSILIRE
jgi:hypothetical protein